MPFALTPELLVPLAVQVLMLASLLAIVFVPFFPGVAVIFVSILAYVGYYSFTLHDLVGVTPAGAVVVVLFGVFGMFSSFFSEKLGLRYTYVSQMVVWGAIIVSLVLGSVLGGVLWFSLGLVVGAIAMEMHEGRSFVSACQQGTAAIYSMLGPRGFQLLAAMILVEWGSPDFVHESLRGVVHQLHE